MPACAERSRPVDDDDAGDDDDSASDDDDSASDDDDISGDDDDTSGDDDDTSGDDDDDTSGDDDDDTAGDPCADEARQLIYVIDRDYRLHSYSPTNNQFSLIGPLNCPAGPSWPQWGDVAAATPFSMSVDRQARAWVLYSSGEIFRVSTQDASCQTTGFVAGQQNFKLFGMGFSSDAPGASTDTLFISGGDFSLLGTLDANNARLGSISTTSMGVTSLGPVPSGEYTPELSGNGDGDLFAYYPGLSGATIKRLDKQTGSQLQNWSLPASAGTVAAWAFANWGGRFYVFLSTGDGFGFNASVYRFDPATGAYDEILSNTGNVVVGAGVSTCAPISPE